MTEQVGSPWRAVIESMFKIVPKPPNLDDVDETDLLSAGSIEAVPFKLNWAQAHLDANMGLRNLVPKARQLGISSYMIGRFTAKGMALKNRRMVMISHEKEATKRLLQRAHFMLNNLRLEGVDLELEIDTERLSKMEIVFKDTGSWFWIGTAGADSFSRGDTITDIHGSEVAYWPDPQGLIRGLVGSASPGAEITLESTGNGVANDFAVRVNRSLRGGSPWQTFFYPWHDHPEYVAGRSDEEALKALGELREELDEPRLAAEFGLTPRRLLWRRYKIEDLNGDLIGFKQEFPMTVDECFQSTGRTVFRRVTYEPTPRWKVNRGQGGGDAWLDGHPRVDRTYILGVDPSGGVGLDQAVIQVGCIEDNEQVGVWWSTRTPPDLLVPKVTSIGHEFNDALVVVESNNHGLVVLEGLRSHYPRHLLYQHKPPQNKSYKQVEGGLMSMGFYTNQRTKALAVGRLADMLANGFKIHDEMTYMDLQAFIESEPGKMEAEEGAHDDTVMALVMMGLGFPQGLRQIAARKRVESQRTSKWSLDAMLDDIRRKGNVRANLFGGRNALFTRGRFGLPTA